MTGRIETVLRKGMDLMYIGFSCRTASGLNADKQSGSACITDLLVQTSSTFAGALKALKALRPSGALLENVCGLIQSGQAGAAAQFVG